MTLKKLYNKEQSLRGLRKIFSNEEQKLRIIIRKKR
jgi:hypothetical protein